LLDGNKRIGHAAMEQFLDINGYDFQGLVDEQEQVTLAVAAGQMERGEFAAWVTNHAHPRASAQP
jgi:death-on-curing protein